MASSGGVAVLSVAQLQQVRQAVQAGVGVRVLGEYARFASDPSGSSLGNSTDDQLEIAFRLKGRAGAFRKTVPQAKDWEALGLDPFDPDFPSQLYRYMQKAKTIHFDLTGMRMINAPDGVLRGPAAWNNPGSTNWELRTIWDDPILRGKTRFYINGKVINEGKVLKLPD